MKEKALPANWSLIELKFLGKYINGRAFKPTEWKSLGLPIIRIQNLNNPRAEYNYSDGNFDSKFLVKKGDLLMAWSASLGVYIWDGESAWLNQHIFKVVTNEQIVTKKFLFYALKEAIEEFYRKTHGTGIVHITKPVFEAHKIPLPPLAQQKRIVAKLDEAFQHLDVFKAKLERIPKLLKKFRQTVLTHAVTGKLTEEWRKGKELEEWELKKIEDICISITDGDHQAPPQASSGVPFLVISNVSKGFFDFNSVTRFVPWEYFNSLNEKRIPCEGDVLYTVTGSYGIPLLVDFKKEFCFQRHIAILKPDNQKVSSSFLALLLGSSDIKKQADAVATGTAQMTVPLRGIRNFEASIPGIEEQEKIAIIVKLLFSKVDLIFAQYLDLKKKVEQLPQSLLAKAFLGELVIQNGSYEAPEEMSDTCREPKAVQ